MMKWGMCHNESIHYSLSKLNYELSLELFISLMKRIKHSSGVYITIKSGFLCFYEICVSIGDVTFHLFNCGIKIFFETRELRVLYMAWTYQSDYAWGSDDHWKQWQILAQVPSTVHWDILCSLRHMFQVYLICPNEP